MTADEIRSSQFESGDGAWECARWLKEIAAQLAELNAKPIPPQAVVTRERYKAKL